MSGHLDPFAPVGLAGSVGSVGFSGSPSSEPTGNILDNVKTWIRRFVVFVGEDDADTITLWIVHTHLALELYTTPRLTIDSPVPGSGKTTLIEHMQRLCFQPLTAASLSSPAMLARVLDNGPRTILIDEVDRALNPKKEGVEDLIAVLNSGYKRGGTRPVLIPVKGGGWEVAEMTTFAPVAMAGNQPVLPDDTRQRSIRVLLFPDTDGHAEESDWERLDGDAELLAETIAQWADSVRQSVRGGERPALPVGVIGRNRERWMPLKRVAVAAGGRWPAVVDRLATVDLERQQLEKEDGMIRERPALVLLRDLAAVWGPSDIFVPTTEIIGRLIEHNPATWGEGSSFGRPLNPQRLGRMLASSWAVHSSRQGDSPRGYRRLDLAPACRRMGIHLPTEPTEPPEPPEPTAPVPPGEPATAATPLRACEVCGEPLGSLDDGFTTHASCEAVR